MRKLTLAIVVGVLVASCGGSSDSGGGASDSGGGNDTDLPDPCALVDDAILEDYFTEAVEGEPGETGPLVNCRWRDSNANSVLVQVRAGSEVNRPDSCDGCKDLSFGDDGYAWTSPLQSGADFVVGTTWYSVTTTGLGDDVDSIASLAEKVYENATG
jgi:hypothetical protein